MATVRFTLVGVCYTMLGCLVLLTTGEGTIFSFLCMCALSLLWPERSRAKTTWPGLFLSVFQSCFEDGGLFLVMDAG